MNKITIMVMDYLDKTQEVLRDDFLEWALDVGTQLLHDNSKEAKENVIEDFITYVEKINALEYVSRIIGEEFE